MNPVLMTNMMQGLIQTHAIKLTCFVTVARSIIGKPVMTKTYTLFCYLPVICKSVAVCYH